MRSALSAILYGSLALAAGDLSIDYVDPLAYAVLGAANVSVVAQQNTKFAHEAGVFFPELRKVFFTSNQLSTPNGTVYVTMSLYDVDTNDVEQIYPPTNGSVNASISTSITGNGATRYGNKVVVCDQGTGNRSGSLVLMSLTPPYDSTVLVDSFYGRQLNSPNDVAVNPHDNTLWFTDPDYAYRQKLRSTRELPNQVYAYDPVSETMRVVTDSETLPNGIAFSADGSKAYVTDTAAFDIANVDDRNDPAISETLLNATATIYVYDVVPLSKRGGYTLANRRVFAFADTPAPDGIKVDVRGNVWAGCSDGLHVWDSDGYILGKFLVDGGVSNFCFTDPGDAIAFNEKRIIKISNVNALLPF